MLFLSGSVLATGKTARVCSAARLDIVHAGRDQKKEEAQYRRAKLELH